MFDDFNIFYINGKILVLSTSRSKILVKFCIKHANITLQKGKFFDDLGVRLVEVYAQIEKSIPNLNELSFKTTL